MQHRKSASSFGRPSGTDGSDFSFRMVVDSRYTKVAKGKSRLNVLLIAQVGFPLFFFLYVILFLLLGVKDTADRPPIFLKAIIQLMGGLSTYLLSTPKLGGLIKLATSTVALGLISLIIGELGRRCSRVNFLRLYMITSPIAFLLSTAFVVQENSLMKVLQNIRGGDVKKFELLGIGYVVLGFLLQISTISTIISLIRNMSPPKRAS